MDRLTNFSIGQRIVSLRIFRRDFSDKSVPCPGRGGRRSDATLVGGEGAGRRSGTSWRAKWLGKSGRSLAERPAAGWRRIENANPFVAVRTPRGSRLTYERSVTPRFCPPSIQIQAGDIGADLKNARSSGGRARGSDRRGTKGGWKRGESWKRGRGRWVNNRLQVTG